MGLVRAPTKPSRQGRINFQPRPDRQPMTFRTDVWGEVLRPPVGEPLITQVRVESTASSGFLVLIRQGSSEYDIWLQDEEDVMHYLSSMKIAWGDEQASVERP